MLEGMKSRGFGRTWIGGNDIDEEGTWKWTDGSPFEFTFWRSGEPNNHNHNEDCMMHGFPGKWNDGPCTGWTKYIDGFLCSKKKGPGRN